jgi:hypothetical protein
MIERKKKIAACTVPERYKDAEEYGRDAHSCHAEAQESERTVKTRLPAYSVELKEVGGAKCPTTN